MIGWEAELRCGHSGDSSGGLTVWSSGEVDKAMRVETMAWCCMSMAMMMMMMATAVVAAEKGGVVMMLVDGGDCGAMVMVKMVVSDGLGGEDCGGVIDR
ncbi:hypothetical protein Tco_0944960 [Tanacetum coccineum]